jgi:coiled-coil domain-containing protein 55
MASTPGISLGLKFAKKPSSLAKPAPAKRKPIFGQDDDDDDDDNDAATRKKADTNIETVAEFDDNLFSTSTAPRPPSPSRKDKLKRKQNAPPSAPPTLSSRAKNDAGVKFGDLSSTRESQKHAAAAMELDPTIYDYDAVYDSLKPAKKTAAEEAAAAADAERRPKYMDNLPPWSSIRPFMITTPSTTL